MPRQSQSGLPGVTCDPANRGNGVTRRLRSAGAPAQVAAVGLLLLAAPEVLRASAGLDRIVGPPQPSKVPTPLRQGEFLSPQSVSALAISPDGHQVAVTTMAFRHDRSFWLLADDGRVLWGRYLEPWAPGQVAFVPQGKRFAVGLAYSRFTDPHPTLAIFDGENDPPI